jgi:GNAT superfamily N-acetyltransferase
MAEIVIRRPNSAEYPRVHAFQCEYLDQESLEAFDRKLAEATGHYLAAFDGDEVVGVCYGCQSSRDANTMALQGIAVSLDTSNNYARTGIGSRLNAAFEQCARSSGYARIDLGSADDLKVERFYLKNGYVPYELVAKDADYEELTRVAVDDYASGKALQQQLRDQYRSATEVIFIFHKSLV